MTLAGLFLHGFGVRYDLPISLALYLYGAAGVVVISFVMVAVFAGDRLGDRAVRYPTIRARLLTRIDRSPWSRRIGGAVGVLVLLAIIVTGILGSQNPLISPAEYLLWVYFWAGLVILSGLVGNLWEYLNPFAALYGLLSRFVQPATRELPPRLGIWPAIVLYFGFAFFELASGVANQPVLVGGLCLAYTLLTVAGMLVFGRDQWLGRVEFITILFDLVGRFSPIERDQRGDLRFRPWGVGLLRPYIAGWDRITFVLLTLSTLAFDGITATQAYQVTLTQQLEPLWLPFGNLGFAVYKGLSLLVLTCVFLIVFTIFVRLVIYFGYVKVDAMETMTAFALTLIPIALVYNAAHNYTYLVVQSQGLPQAFQRTFTSGPPPPFVANFALANAAVVWYVQVVLIVIGHVIAVYLAHLRAGERFRTAKNALLSQYPMLILMVGYTMTSLWILAQPTTRGG